MDRKPIVSAARRAALALLIAAPLCQADPIDLTVMTRNLFQGAELGPIFAATDLPGVVGAVAGVWANVQASDPAGRMARIATEIQAAQPQIVGLQEAVLWRTQTPSDFLPGNASNAQFGGAYYQVLQSALAGLGLSYTAYAVAQNGDNELPGLDPGSPSFLTDYRLTDYDAILVRNDVPVVGSGTVTYAAQLSVPLLGTAVSVPRSFGYVDVDLSGTVMRLFNTHLEAVAGVVNNLQGLELIGALGASPYPRISLGDFNTITDIGTTQVYQNMLGAGYGDAWAEKGGGPGYTWRNDPLLNDPGVDLTQRLDYIFHSGGFRTVSVAVVGGDADSSTPPLWPSDHAGLVATLRFIPEPGTLLLVAIALSGLGLGRRFSRS